MTEPYLPELASGMNSRSFVALQTDGTQRTYSTGCCGELNGGIPGSHNLRCVEKHVYQYVTIDEY
ncbi:MAG: hypothetical protein RLY87_1263 [Chloroflexota bacterium]